MNEQENYYNLMFALKQEIMFEETTEDDAQRTILRFYIFRLKGWTL